MDKVRINVSITSRQHQQLLRAAFSDRLPMAEIIRRALDTYLARDDPAYRTEPHRPTPKQKFFEELLKQGLIDQSEFEMLCKE